MKSILVFIVGGLSLGLVGGCKSTGVSTLDGYDRPYITTQSPLTLLSSNDGEKSQSFLRTLEGVTDWNMKVRDSFTVIHLGPDHPPLIKTVYDTVPTTVLGTPSMAMSKDGRFGLITNHGFRNEKYGRIIHPEGPLTNDDLTSKMLNNQHMTAQHANMLSLIDLSTPDYKVVHRVLFDDFPVHVLAHPDGERFIVGASKHFYIFKIVGSRLVQISKNPQPNGLPCFWIHPRGDRLIATQAVPDKPIIPGKPSQRTQPATVQWYSIKDNRIDHLTEIKVKPGLPTKLLITSMILRVSSDGKLALICQRSMPDGKDLCDILIADLTLGKPVINGVIKQVADGIESFAFHPNGKMAVATGLSADSNCIAVLDIASRPARLLYTLDAKEHGQGIEFTPEGDKLFVGSAITGRIEVFDVVGDFELRKNPKFLNIGFGHSSLTIGPHYLAGKAEGK